MDTKKHLQELFEFLAFPTISAQSDHKSDIQEACFWLHRKLSDLGFTADILPTGGHPVVYAENLTAGSDKPTVLIYGHYDVQAPDPLNEWLSNPFKPEVRNNNIYARGAADDKGQLYTWIAAVEEILADQKNLPVNVKFLIEGEEEVGSKNLDEFILDNRSRLTADICVISDSHALSEDQPMIDYGLRGLVYTELSLKALNKDVHSGIYGGNVLNPAIVLTHILAKLKDEKHKILIPGFYDNVRQLEKQEVEELAQFPFSVKEVSEETGAKTVIGEAGFSVAARAGARPTLDINGIWSGYTGEGPKTIIPAVASAKISMRLVPHQTSDEIYKKFKSFVEAQIPEGIEYSLDLVSDGEPILIDTKSHYFKAAVKSYEKVFGKKPLLGLSGGSIPITATLKQNLNIDSILMGYGLPDDGLHSPNEKLSVNMFAKGIKTNIEFLTSL